MAKGKKGGGGAKNLLKDGILPDKFADILIGKDSKDKGQSIVASYAKVMEPHVLRHFETFVNTFIGDKANLTPIDFIHYNTYGDYQMVLADGKIAFEYRALNKVGGTFDTLTSGPTVEGLYGVYSRGDPSKREGDREGFSLSVENIKMLKEELNKGSSGLRLMLPSIGTMIMMTYGYTNINKELQSLLKKVLNKVDTLMNSYDENFNSLDHFLGLISVDVGDEVSKDLSYEDFQAEALRRQEEMTLSSALDYVADKLIESSTARFDIGETVSFKDNAKIPNDIQRNLLEFINTDLFDITDFTYRIDGYTKDDKGKVSYTIEPIDASESGTVSGVSENLLVPLKEPNKSFQKKKDKFIAIPAASKIVSYSRIFDKLFAMHNYAYIVQDKDFNFAYISPAINKSKKREQEIKAFPKMFSPRATDSPKLDQRMVAKVNENNSFLKNILQLRNAYTMMVLKTQRANMMDSRIFDEFYKDDLGLKEIKWLAFMLSEGGKVIVKKPEKINALSQLTYVPTGSSDDVQLYGEANRRTIFYQVDIPMLKEVILEYVYTFNELTVRNAYSLESNKKGGNEGAIAKALWGSIKRRTGVLFENTEVIPFEFFSQLFNGVNQVINEGEVISFDPYPPNWTDTNVLTLLTVDPSELNTFLSAEEYTQRLTEYLDYLFVRYGNRPRIAAAILTAIEGYRIANSLEYQKLRTEFIDMIETHNKKSQLKGTEITFQAYTLVLSIMRAELAVPMQLRDDYVAEGYEKEALKSILDDRKYEDRLKIAAAPKGHPLYKEPTPKEVIKALSEEEEPEEEEPEEEEPEEEGGGGEPFRAHSLNNHFNGLAQEIETVSRSPESYMEVGEPIELDPSVRPGTVDNPVCSSCLEEFHNREYGPLPNPPTPRAFIFIIEDDGGWPEYDENKLPMYTDAVEAIKEIIPPFVKYLTNSKQSAFGVGPISRKKYMKYGPGRGGPRSRSWMDFDAMIRDFPELAPYSMSRVTHNVNVVTISNAPIGAFADGSRINFNKQLSPKEGAVVWAHEIGHGYGNGPSHLHKQYHNWASGDKHCPYNCMFHHYASCGNIAVGKEEQIYDSIVLNYKVKDTIEVDPSGEVTAVLATGAASTGDYQALPRLNPVTSRGTPLTAATAFTDFTTQIMNHAPDYKGNASDKIDGMLISAEEFSKTVALWKRETDRVYTKVTAGEEPVFVKANIEIPKGMKLFVVGDIHCGIHTLTNFLSNNLKVNADWSLPPQAKLAFCGDFVDRGPYGIEVLYTVLKLHAANPERVFLCKGNHEDFETFNRYGLTQEIEYQFESDFSKPYSTVVSDMLEVTGSLPSALFVTIEGKGKLQLCHGGIVHCDHPHHDNLKRFITNESSHGELAGKETYHPLKWADFTASEDYMGKARGLPDNEFGLKQVEEYCESLGLVGIISGHQDYHRHQVITTADRTLALKADMGLGASTSPVFNLPENSSQAIKFEPQLRSIITSMAFPTRPDIQYPAWVEIEN